eukprot:tig00021127_g18834.t1
MFDHLSIGCSDMQRSQTFYDACMPALGYKRLMGSSWMAIYGPDGEPRFFVSTRGEAAEQLGKARGMHIAFRAPSRQAVDEWHRAAVAAGGKDNGAPGPRAQYHPNYYAAFVMDPDGWRLEAVCHTPP